MKIFGIIIIAVLYLSNGYDIGYKNGHKDMALKCKNIVDESTPTLDEIMSGYCNELYKQCKKTKVNDCYRMLENCRYSVKDKK